MVLRLRVSQLQWPYGGMATRSPLPTMPSIRRKSSVLLMRVFRSAPYLTVTLSMRSFANLTSSLPPPVCQNITASSNAHSERE